MPPQAFALCVGKLAPSHVDKPPAERSSRNISVEADQRDPTRIPPAVAPTSKQESVSFRRGHKKKTTLAPLPAINLKSEVSSQLQMPPKSEQLLSGWRPPLQGGSLP